MHETYTCPACGQDKPLEAYLAPRASGLVRKDVCTPCRRAAAQARRDARHQA